MTELFESAGAPRDQGLDQGLAHRGAVRDRAARAGARTRRRRVFGLGPFAAGPVLGRGPGREFIRHYTHLAERAEGLALGSDLRLETLVELLFEKPGMLARSAPALALGQGTGLRTAVARALPRPAGTSERWLLRRSRPEVGFASVEVTLAWLASSVGGVNECGLAAAIAPGAEPALGSLLVQEVLQRFGDLASAVDWCAKRPGSGDGSLLIADAGGAAAAVHLEGEARHVERGLSGTLVGGVDGAEASELRKRLDEWIARGEDTAAEEAASCLAACAPGAGRLVLLPAEGRLLFTDEAGATAAIEALPGAGPPEDA